MTKEIVKRTGVLPAEQSTPVNMMMVAIEKGYDLDQIEKLMDLQERNDQAQAKKAFVSAMAKFKSLPIKIPKDSFNKQFGSWYTSIGVLVNTVLPFMGQCGLSHKWETEQPSMQIIKTTCTVTHEMGHSESGSMIAPPDKSGSKNPIQEIKSTRTYLQAATFEDLMGLASTNACINDDGNGAAPAQAIEYINDDQKGQLFDMVAAISELDPDRNAEKNLIKFMKVSSLELITADRFNVALSTLKKVLENAKAKSGGAE